MSESEPKSFRAKALILAINAGSSSIKFGLYQSGEVLTPMLNGKLERIDQDCATLTYSQTGGALQSINNISAGNRKSVINFLVHWFEQQAFFSDIRAIGHRVTHGLHHVSPERVTESLLNELHYLCPNNSEHLPREIELIEAIHWRHPVLIQVACFDTAFHRTMPLVAKLLSIPRRFADKGMQRCGFHGLSYSFLMQELERLGDPAAKKGRVILAHLGNGASMAAILNGKSIDTSMGFTPTGGLPMSTRSGDIDPGVVHYLALTEQMTPAQIQHVLKYESGLLGVSEISADVRELLAEEDLDLRATEALALFCYQAKKLIGAYAAALGGLDTLVFSGGIGENLAVIRKRICSGLGFLGIELHDKRNLQDATLISTENQPVKIRVIRTNEELMIARSVADILPTRRLEPRELTKEDYL
jgi:acetate kinase